MRINSIRCRSCGEMYEPKTRDYTNHPYCPRCENKKAIRRLLAAKAKAG